MAQQNVVLKAKGLYTHFNVLSAVPEGALIEAINVVIDRNEVIEPRRGFAKFGDFGLGPDRAKQLINYKERILVHYGETLAYDSTGTGSFTDFNGTYNEPDPGIRIKSIESNGNLYFTTNEGIKKISALSNGQFTSASGYITDAGGVKALDPECTPNYSTSGFFSPLSKVAYRIIWGYTDANDNLVLGSPSARTVVENTSSTDSCVVDISFPIPDAVTNTNFFYQVYRTGVFTAATLNDLSDLDPGDEMYLVLEDFPSSAELVAGSISIQDITPEDFRQSGALLYTNPVSGEGIEQSNEPPPFAHDIALYKGFTFYANTYTRQRLTLSQISVQTLVTGVSTLTFTDGVTSRVYTYQGTNETFTADFSGMTFPGGKANLDGKYFTVISANDLRTYKIWFDNTGSTTEPVLAGSIPVKIDISAVADTAIAVADKTKLEMDLLTFDFNIISSSGSLDIACANNGEVTTTPTDTIGSGFTITADGLGTGEDAATQKIFLPRVPTGAENGPTTAEQIDQAARSLVRVINEDSSGLVYAFYLSGFNDVPGQLLFESRTLTGDAVYINADSTTTGDEFNPSIPTTGTTVISSNEVNPNRIYYSKYQQPDAVPLVNYIDIGPKDAEIQRIIALRDSLVIFKEDGIYRLTGDSPPFTVFPFDNSASLLAPDSAVILNNQIYAFSSQGVITVTDNGVNVISRPIENQLLSIVRDGFNFRTTTFGISYESERAYFLNIVTNMDDEVATQCFRYNVFTNSWTKWDISKACGIVNRFNDKMYFGPADENFIEQERKNRDRTDHADRDFQLTIPADSIDGTSVEISAVINVDVGDVIVQTQYLTISQFNQLLNKLDNDGYLNDNDYYSLLHLVAGDSLTSAMSALVAKLILDDTTPITQTFAPADVNTGTETITIAAHGFIDNNVVTFSSSGTLPAGLSANTLYYIVNSAPNTFQVALTVAGTPVNITTQGSGTHTVTADYTFSGTSDFAQIQTEFNIIIGKLNQSTGIFFTNYRTSSGTVGYEGIVTEIIVEDNIIITPTPMPFLAGPITHYTAFNTRVTWAPQTFGDPSMYKQVSEGTILFEDNNFYSANIAYSSDLSPSFEQIDFSGLGNGDWGLFGWSEQNWGGVSSSKPLRTYIPRQKQRCRYLNCRFQHKVAFEKFAIYGISLTFRPFSQRPYR